VIGLYAIVLEPPPDAVGAQGEPLRVIRCDGFAALAGAPPPPLSVEALRAHEASVRRMAEACDPCLPARFGSIAPDEVALQRELSGRAAELTDALSMVRGREQMTLRVHGPAAPAPRTTGGSGTRYLEERRRARSFPQLDPLRAALGALVHAERLERHSEPGLLASVYHLIDRGGAAQYRARIEATRLDGLRILASGPWPAWSFAPEVAAP
jgi:hypothetical protein